MPTKSRTSSKPHVAAIRETGRRLFELKREKDYTVQQFADAFGAKLNTVRDWLNGRVLPRAEALRGIAMHFGVTTDWLLGINGAPKFRDQWRADAALADDLAAHVLRKSLPQVKPRPEPPLSDRLAKLIDGSFLLRHLVEEATRDLNATSKYIRNVTANASRSRRAQRVVAFGRSIEGSPYEVDFLGAALAVLNEETPPRVTVIRYPLITPTPAIGPPPGKRHR